MTERLGLVRAPRLYALVDGDTLGLERVAAVALDLARAGVEWLQLRLKSGSDAARWRVALEVARGLETPFTRLWIDDRADFAAGLAAADHPPYGLHLGQRDLPPSAVRATWHSSGGERAHPVLGRSCHGTGQVAAADADPSVDVVAIGPVFTTRSKRDPDPTVGLDGVRAARAATRKPLVAIGGIDHRSIGDVLRAGADTVAVLGAVCSAADPGAAARDLLLRTEAAHHSDLAREDR